MEIAASPEINSAKSKSDGSKQRFAAGILICFLTFGDYFCYSNPAALEDYMLNNLNISISQYVILFSGYSWPNMILCFLGGYFIDVLFGLCLATNLFIIADFAGQLIFASGTYTTHYWLMLIGRVVLGIGGQSLIVSQNNYAALWFKDKELNLVFGLICCVSRLGSTLNFIVVEPIYSWIHQKYSGKNAISIFLFAASTSIIFSMLCSLILTIIHKRAFNFNQKGTNKFSSSKLTISLAEIKQIPMSFWLITLINVLYYSSVVPFLAVAKVFFMSRFHESNQEVSSLMSIIFLFSALGAPIIGYLIDKFGGSLYWTFSALLSIILAHCFFAFTFINLHIGGILIGIAHATLATSLTPLICLIVPEHLLGITYGFFQLALNFGAAVTDLAIGFIIQTYGYTYMAIFFLSLMFIAITLGVILFILDMRNNCVLNSKKMSNMKQK